MKPVAMNAAEINRQRARWRKILSKITDELIAAGRGHETAEETAKMTDPLALKHQEASRALWLLQLEVHRRMGPNWHGDLPRGCGPIKQCT